MGFTCFYAVESLLTKEEAAARPQLTPKCPIGMDQVATARGCGVFNAGCPCELEGLFSAEQGSSDEST